MSEKKFKITKLPYKEPTREEKRKIYGNNLYNWLFGIGAPIDYEIVRDLGNGGRIYKNNYIPFEYDEDNLGYKDDD